MAKQEFKYRGKTVEELQELSIKEFAELLPSRQRRSINRGLDDRQKKLIDDLKEQDEVRTHCRDMIVLPQWVGKVIRIHNGDEFVRVEITPERIGHYLGELAMTRKQVKHSAPGVGATKSSTAIVARAK
jgi:small subunit ribosomal protein S19